MVLNKKARKSIYVKGKTEIFHLYLPKETKIRKKIAYKSDILGLTMHEFILRVLEKNVENIVLDDIKESYIKLKKSNFSKK
jgi:hypothetical protein